MRDHCLTRGECTPAGVADWTDHVKSLGEGLLSNEIDSWMTGINRNVEGKTERIVARYSGRAPAYRCGGEGWVSRNVLDLNVRHDFIPNSISLPGYQ